MSDDDFEIRPGRVRDRGGRSAKPRSLVAQIRALSNKAGRVGMTGKVRRGNGRNARGRSATLSMHSRQGQRRVLVKARVVRHAGTRFSAAPLSRHLTYLKRDGVTRDGKDAELFDSADGPIDGSAFAERCADDRHHFRFIVSPEDAGEMADVRAFTRELLTDMEKDLGTRLDWVAVDHWNADNPHIHILVRGRTDDGRDLVIDRDYIREGMRGRAEERVTIELGPRSEREIDRALAREVNADRWTSLNRRLQRTAAELSGIINLRPNPQHAQSSMDRHLIGRAGKLERLGLATGIAPACWTLKPDLEPTLRQLGVRGDVIKTMHQAMTGIGAVSNPARFEMHPAAVDDPIIGRLIERGLHDELTGEAYAVVDGADGRVHHLRFGDLDQTGDAAPGAIVDVRTWTDRQLLSSDPIQSGGGFGAEIEKAKLDRAEHLVAEGFAERRNGRIILARNILNTLRDRELTEVGAAIAVKAGLPHRPSAEGEHVSGTYCQRLQLASGRFAMIDNGMGFALVPWRPQIDKHLGQHVTGTIKTGGGID